jgi:hypothetical protein
MAAPGEIFIFFEENSLGEFLSKNAFFGRCCLTGFYLQGFQNKD